MSWSYHKVLTVKNLGYNTQFLNMCTGTPVKSEPDMRHNYTHISIENSFLLTPFLEYIHMPYIKLMPIQNGFQCIQNM